MSNAIKFTEKGNVNLRVSELHEFAETRDQELKNSKTQKLLFEIEDTGPGIGPEEMETLFESFAQTRTGARVQEGTGLGLTISQKFVQLLGGRITVRSNVGQGSLFSFAIPVESVQEFDTAPVEISTPPMTFQPLPSPYRMLIVDDKADNRSVLVKLLGHLETRPGTVFDLREAINGQEAVDIWQRWQPEVVWMDLRMPVMTGYEATRIIRHLEAEKYASTPVKPESGHATTIIAVTAGALDIEQTAPQDPGWNSLIHKPFREQDIVAILQRYLRLQPNTVDNGVSPVERNKEVELHIALPELRPEVLASLSEEWVEELRMVVETIDIEATLALIEKIASRMPELAYTLKHLVQHYRFDILQTFVESKENT
jgi:CheY-like chemotaxis protein